MQKFPRMRVAALVPLLLVAACSGDAPGDGSAAQMGSAPAGDKGGGQIAAPAPRGDERLVVVFGDSLYAGYGLNSGEGFAPQLERALTDRGIAARVHNAGVSGDTSAAGLARLAFTLDGLAAGPGARKPDLMLVGLGGNDMLRGISPDQTRANLDAIMAELKRRGIPAMLTGMVAAPNMGADFADDFNAIYPALAGKYAVPLDPFFLDRVITDRTLMLSDGIHPNAAGIRRIIDRVAPVVAGALPAVPPGTAPSGGRTAR